MIWDWSKACISFATTWTRWLANFKPVSWTWTYELILSNMLFEWQYIYSHVLMALVIPVLLFPHPRIPQFSGLFIKISMNFAMYWHLHLWWRHKKWNCKEMAPTTLDLTSVHGVHGLYLCTYLLDIQTKVDCTIPTTPSGHQMKCQWEIRPYLTSNPTYRILEAPMEAQSIVSTVDIQGNWVQALDSGLANYLNWNKFWKHLWRSIP
jgi:hypothetical protein